MNLKDLKKKGKNCSHFFKEGKCVFCGKDKPKRECLNLLIKDSW
jgi:hypothetical protein